MENRIKEHIKAAGVMQKELAEKLDMTTVGLNKIANTPMLKIETFQKVADALGIPVWKLLLSDEELEQIRSEATANRPTDEFRCPKCGALLKVIPTDEEKL
ncbi:helix-turn-helix domain-containing protein [Lepagella muris]|uniref:XRE family transcriptional regulator n=1 Tax=Lepagella muris TaxID=3032870 RepID=A0AC61RMD2_9BACT|nr:helix-turn-helix transcriptional regulator [Lepagella muris]TGY80978.1 XRE family transcriptional regulator [Lepagella muris]THG54056.1 helix-turn-helix transcriptional regulator [Bacteroidales bacterium]TKC56689.1 helix-turn-helix transcriptional regulator [Bacteroidales bacterium]